MIDIENDVFSEVAKKVREKFSDIFVTGEYVKSPSSFPCVSLVEIDNATFRTDGIFSYSAVAPVDVYLTGFGQAHFQSCGYTRGTRGLENYGGVSGISCQAAKS